MGVVAYWSNYHETMKKIAAEICIFFAKRSTRRDVSDGFQIITEMRKKHTLPPFLAPLTLKECALFEEAALYDVTNGTLMPLHVFGFYFSSTADSKHHASRACGLKRNQFWLFGRFKRLKTEGPKKI